MGHDPIYRVTKSYRIIYIIKWHNFDLVLSDIQEIGSQTRKTYKGLELWAMGTLDFFPNQFGGFQMCIPLGQKKKKKNNCCVALKWDFWKSWVGRSVKFFFNNFFKSTQKGQIWVHIPSFFSKNTQSEQNWVLSRPYFFLFLFLNRVGRWGQHNNFFFLKGHLAKICNLCKWILYCFYILW